MLDTKQFKTRADALFESCRDRWRKQLQKQAPRGVKLDIAPQDVLPFNRHEFTQWLWHQVGLRACQCIYCRGVIDITSLQLDHRTPLRRGGGPGLDNLNPLCCARCNGSKGEFTHEEYSEIVAFMEGPAAHFRQRLEGVLTMGKVGTMMRHFPRKKAAGPKRDAKIQAGLSFALSEF